MKDFKREKEGQKATFIGFITNIFLAIFKVILGIVFKSVSVLADGINNASDSLSSLIGYIGFKFSKKPSDKKHPFGHARLEYIATFIIAFTIFTAGVHLIIGSIKKILSKEIFKYDSLLIVFLVISVIVKIILATYYIFISKKINSDILIANAKDYYIDSFSTSLILLSIIILHFLKVSIDGYIGILIGVLIIKLSIEILIKAINKLIGTRIDKEKEKMIKEIILSKNNVLGLHDLIIHDYGPNNIFASAHIEINSKTSLINAHKILDSIEREILEKYQVHLVLHADPVEIDNERLSFFKNLILEELFKINNLIDAHDFRLEKEKDLEKLYFDIIVPENINIKDEDIKKILSEKLIKYNISLVLTIDRNYTYKNI